MESHHVDQARPPTREPLASDSGVLELQVWVTVSVPGTPCV
jgi:hypothetical protein